MIQSKICENDECQASYVPETKNQIYCNECLAILEKKAKEYARTKSLLNKYERRSS